MEEVPPPDIHHVNAAIGWAELGNVAEARAELAQVSPQFWHHPSALEAEWTICSEERNWRGGLEVSKRLLEVDPDNVMGWISRSFCLHELKRTPEAFDALLPAVKLFPDISTVPYNLACYTCQMGRLAECWKWLRRVIALRGKDELKAQALADDDFRPIWADIRLL